MPAPLVVQKYGGSVLTEESAFTVAAHHVARTVAAGKQVVAVVSAMYGMTDRLLERARAVCPDPPLPSLDLLLATGELQSAALLAMALHREGISAEALNPWQFGLHTDAAHGDATITRINPLPLRVKLVETSVVIVPGFIGRGEDERLTTLGRGGSDLSAVALAHALNADACEFFKDVPGYFSADPRLLRNAIHRPAVTGEEAMELSAFGCRFLQDRAIRWAVKSRCRVRLRALGDDVRATSLVDVAPPDHPKFVALTYCDVPTQLAHRVPPEFGPHAALISMVGTTLGTDPDLPNQLVATLSAKNISAVIADSAPSRLSVAVAPDSLRAATDALHDHFVRPHATPPEKGQG